MRGVRFKDQNFRLACLDILFAQGRFAEQLEEVLAVPVADDEDVPNAERLRLLNNIPITQELCDSIIDFAPDGGDDVYFHAFPSWGGTEDELYIRSFADLRHLRKLQELSVHAVTFESALDLSLLLQLPALEEVFTDWFYVDDRSDSQHVIDELKQRGVSLTIQGTRKASRKQ